MDEAIRELVYAVIIDLLDPAPEAAGAQASPAPLAIGNVCDTMLGMTVVVREYLDSSGRSPFARWFDGLSAPAAAKVTTALTRIEAGNFSSVKGVGSGVFECRIDFGPGYRVYFGKDGDTLVILVAGGSKKHQQDDIQTAQDR